MNIIVGENAGFCFGVRNAVNNTIDELKNDKKIYCLGELVHNKQVTDELKTKGVIFINRIEEAKGKTIIRAHGVPLNVYEKAKKMKIELKDLTCPKVLAIHKLAIKYKNEDYYIFLVGQKEHPEVIGTISFCGDNCSIIENTEDIEKEIEKYKKSNLKKAVVLAQTTISSIAFNNIVDKIKEYIENVEVKNTICTATKIRQKETENIAKQVDCMVIIGGKHSSNTIKLYDIAKKNCKNVFLVENKNDLEIEKIRQWEDIGIMAGASTPEKSIKEIVDILRKKC